MATQKLTCQVVKCRARKKKQRENEGSDNETTENPISIYTRAYLFLISMAKIVTCRVCVCVFADVQQL